MTDQTARVQQELRVQRAARQAVAQRQAEQDRARLAAFYEQQRAAQR